MGKNHEEGDLKMVVHHNQNKTLSSLDLTIVQSICHLGHRLRRLDIASLLNDTTLPDVAASKTEIKKSK